MVIGSRSNFQLLFSSTEQQFHAFNTKSPFGKSYLCNDPNCKTRVYLIEENSRCIQLNNSYKHEHEIKTKEYKKIQVLNEVKRRCAELKFLLSGHRITARETFASVMQE